MSASRTAKSPKQRATEALGIAERKHAAALKREKAAKKALEQAEADVTRAASRLAHRRADPDLREDPQLPLGEA